MGNPDSGTLLTVSAQATPSALGRRPIGISAIRRSFGIAPTTTTEAATPSVATIASHSPDTIMNGTPTATRIPVAHLIVCQLGWTAGSSDTPEYAALMRNQLDHLPNFRTNWSST